MRAIRSILFTLVILLMLEVPVNSEIPNPSAYGSWAYVTFGSPLNIYVDCNTNVSVNDQNGTISKPFSTIQSAINVTYSANVDVGIFIGRTILIASGYYDEDVVCTGDTRRISLIGFGNVMVNSVTVNYSEASQSINGINPGFCLSSDNLAWRSSRGPNDGNIGKFVIVQQCTVTNSSPTAIDLEISATVGNVPFPAAGNALTPSLQVTGPVNLYCRDSKFYGPINGSNAIDLQVAENTVFFGMVNVVNYGLVQSCAFMNPYSPSSPLTLGGMSITTTTTPRTQAYPQGMLMCYFDTNTLLQGVEGGSSRFDVDSITSYWINTNGVTESNTIIFRYPI